MSFIGDNTMLLKRVLRDEFTRVDGASMSRDTVRWIRASCEHDQHDVSRDTDATWPPSGEPIADGLVN
jgi:hypothetical protein